MNAFRVWLQSAWFRVPISALVLLSAGTSAIGARAYVVDNAAFAWLLAIGVNGSLFVFSYFAKKQERLGLRFWVGFLFFAAPSVYLSALGCYNVSLLTELKVQNREQLSLTWHETGSQLRRFRGECLSWIAGSIRIATSAREAERARIRMARSESRSYDPSEFARLSNELRVLRAVSPKAKLIPTLSVSLPVNDTDAWKQIGSALADASDIYAEMPESFRVNHRAPSVKGASPIETGVQDQFWLGLKNQRPAAVFAAASGIFIDLLPLVFFLSLREFVTVADRIRRLRWRLADLLRAVVERPLSYRPKLNVEIRNSSSKVVIARASLALGMDRRRLYRLNDVRDAVTSLSAQVGSEMARRFTIEKFESELGNTVDPNLPLVSQLEGGSLRLLVGEEPAGRPN